MNIKKAGIAFVLGAVLSLLTCSLCPAMPKVTKTELPNQLKVLVFQEHSVPAVTLELLVGAGSSLDPQGMGGLANLTARSLALGTRNFSFDQINDKLDFMGATYGVECTKDFAIIGMQVLKKDLHAGVGLFTQIVEHPSFPAADVAMEKELILGRLREDEDNPLKIANRAFDKALFLDSPYAGSVQGDKTSVAAIAPGQVAIFYTSYYRPNNAILVIGGDITPGEVKTRIIPKLLGWKAGPVPEPIFQTPSARGTAKVAIDKPLSQAAIVVGCSAMERSGRDYYPFLVLSQILGSGGLSGRLMTDIRTNRGLAYTVRSRLVAYEHAGSFRVFLRTENASVKEATALVQKELERLKSERVSTAELKAAKEFLIGNFPLRYSLPGNFARFLAEAQFYGLGPDYMQRYPALIDSVTAGDIQRVARKYLALRNVVVIVGDLKRMSDIGGRVSEGSHPATGIQPVPPKPAPKKPGPAQGEKAPVGPAPGRSGKGSAPATGMPLFPPRPAPKKPSPAHGRKVPVGPAPGRSGKKSPPGSIMRPVPTPPASEKPGPAHGGKAPVGPRLSPPVDGIRA